MDLSEVSQREARIADTEQAFDYFDDQQMRSLCGEYLWEPVQGLLSIQAELTTLSAEAVKAEVTSRLKRLEQALRLKFREDY